jgi:hypothetical protein
MTETNDDDDYKKAIKARAYEIIFKEEKIKPAVKRTRHVTEEQKARLTIGLESARAKAKDIREAQKEITKQLKEEMKDEFQIKKQKYIRKMDDQKQERELKKQSLKNPQPVQQVQPIIPVQPVQPIIPVVVQPVQPIVQQVQAPIKATYFRPNLAHYKKHFGSQIF